MEFNYTRCSVCNRFFKGGDDDLLDMRQQEHELIEKLFPNISVAVRFQVNEPHKYREKLENTPICDSCLFEAMKEYKEANPDEDVIEGFVEYLFSHINAICAYYNEHVTGLSRELATLEKEHEETRDLLAHSNEVEAELTKERDDLLEQVGSLQAQLDLAKGYVTHG